MFAAYAGLQIWALRRLPSHGEPTLLQELYGRFAFHQLWPLIALPLTASISYAAWLQLELSVSAIENYVFLLSSSLQVCIGLGVLIASHVRRAKQSRRAVIDIESMEAPAVPVGVSAPSVSAGTSVGADVSEC